MAVTQELLTLNAAHATQLNSNAIGQPAENHHLLHLLLFTIFVMA